MKTDWDIVTKGFITVLWCGRSCELAQSENPFHDEFDSFLRETSHGILPMNVGTLMMASYLMFVYPRERELNELPMADLKLDDFKQSLGKTKDKSAFIGRLRNAIAHGRWSVANEQIKFDDGPNRNVTNWSATIRVLDFGKFLNQFYQKSMFKALLGSPNKPFN